MRRIFLVISIAMCLQVNINAGNYKEAHRAYSTNKDAGVMNQLVSAMSDQLTQNKNFDNIQESKIAITSFVCLDNFNVTSRISNIISENFIHELQVRGYKVIDFKTMNNIQVDHHGDFLFSRDIKKLRTSLNIDYALTGTYVKYKSGTVINARIIDLSTHVVLSSAQILIPSRVMKRISSVGRTIPNFTPHKVMLSR